MNAVKYLQQTDGQLVKMVETDYDSEDFFQKLLVKYPDLLAGEQMGSERERRLLLVKREMGIPPEEDGSNRWSVDHLYLDQGGIPTFVEVKRRRDPRIRREWVGQMLDYAANAVRSLTMEGVRTEFGLRCKRDDKNADEELRSFLCSDMPGEKFWGQVKNNLEAGKIRLLFVADEIPTEVQSIVEFLSDQMKSVEVGAVEIKQFTGQGHRSFETRVIGLASQAEQTKSASAARRSRQWDENSFFEELSKRISADAMAAAHRLVVWIRHSGEICWGRGNQSGSCAAIIPHHGVQASIFTLYSYGKVEVTFEYLKSNPPFQSEAKRLELMDRLNAVLGNRMSRDSISKRPNIPLEDLKNPAVMEMLLKVFDWVAASLKEETPKNS